MPLVLVPTPVGNLRDITLRAIDTLRAADLIVAEDTRVGRKLLAALGIPGRELRSYREQNAGSATPGILERARSELVAVTTDAGMPGISDPGTELVAAARRAGVAVEVLPGPSAAFAIAVLSGFSLRRFCFEGFAPRTSGARRQRFAAALQSGATTLWYESPRRIHDTLADLAAVAPQACVFLGRELSKMHEQHLYGAPAEVAAALERPVRGEIAFAIAPVAAVAREPVSDARIDELLAQGRSVAAIAKALSHGGAGERRTLYARIAARKNRDRGPRKPLEKTSERKR
ncbi:MAG: 16S rRNA (cytidine(1402)-2'-O)-methyltransferase [Candidatus Eremiobacteraeota bacterium]|nr:16S rRNA (cytidine(1402)-2'-O)-methyltransferase [Candidatus Eremiobacteraeota bacterium]